MPLVLLLLSVLTSISAVRSAWATSSTPQLRGATPSSGDLPTTSLEPYGRPQQLVDIGGRRLNLYCLGQGSPTVILEGGLEASTIAWRKVHAELAKSTRVCAYDRAGYGFSDPGPLPRDTRSLAEDLAALMKAARLQPPYVLVGASLGGGIVRLYADTHWAVVGGMVLVDPHTEHEEHASKPPRRVSSRELRGETIRCARVWPSSKRAYLRRGRRRLKIAPTIRIPSSRPPSTTTSRKCRAIRHFSEMRCRKPRKSSAPERSRWKPRSGLTERFP